MDTQRRSKGSIGSYLDKLYPLRREEKAKGIFGVPSTVDHISIFDTRSFCRLFNGIILWLFPGAKLAVIAEIWWASNLGQIFVKQGRGCHRHDLSPGKLGIWIL